jgi:hypothetical protein
VGQTSRASNLIRHQCPCWVWAVLAGGVIFGYLSWCSIGHGKGVIGMMMS